jgi:hypothetical protein
VLRKKADQESQGDGGKERVGGRRKVVREWRRKGGGGIRERRASRSCRGEKGQLELGSEEREEERTHSSHRRTGRKKRLHRLTNNFNCRPRADVLPQELEEVKVLARRRVEIERRLFERRDLEVARPVVPSLDEVVLSDNDAGLILIDERISCSVGRERTEVESEAGRREGVGGEGEVEIERGRRGRERVEG